jgi:NADP-dependent 3-hydroxy acid dehydrogenase YdfG
MILNNKIVLITGASSGIGAACAAQFAKQGAQLLLCSRNMQKLKEFSRQLQAAYTTPMHIFPLDVRDADSVIRTLHGLPDEWKNVDILLNNAGLAAGLDTLQEGEVADWDEMIDTNVKGLLYVTKAILPQMVKRNVGHVINIGSIAGHVVYPKGAVYCATKHAVNALSNGLRMDLLGTNIRVSTIDPGMVQTNFSMVRFKGDSARAQAIYEGLQPLTPDDIADAVLYCATRPSHVNISEVILMPTHQASATLVHREK